MQLARHELRRSAGHAWWLALGWTGLTQERWESLPRVARRAIVTAFWLLVGIILVWVGGVINGSVFLAALVAFALIVPPFERVKVGPYRVGRFIAPAALLALAVLYPYSLGNMFQWPFFGPFPAMNTMVVMAVFVMMALGLNVVVGYAGLL